jgi:hypothetical protein
MRRVLVALTSLLIVAASATTAEAAPAAPELGGGSTLFHIGDPSPAPCTAAFAATDGSGGYVLVAAGSGCGGTLYSGNVVEVGPVVASLPGNLAIVRVANPADWTLVPWVGDGVTFTGSGDPVVGGPVCLIEADGVAGCGSVQAVDLSVDFPDGVVNHVAVTDVHADLSGHAVTFVSGSSLEGVLIGADVQSSYFEPAGRLLSEYGLQLLV